MQPDIAEVPRMTAVALADALSHIVELWRLLYPCYPYAMPCFVLFRAQDIRDQRPHVEREPHCTGLNIDVSESTQLRVLRSSGRDQGR